MQTGTPNNSDVEVSIVTSLYYSAADLPEFCRRVRAEAEKLSSRYEIVLVNDGSPDDSLEVALKQQQLDSRIRIVDLSRNFGQHKALMTGLEHSRGRLIFLIDSDLEEDPELLSRFHDEMQRTEADVVFGVQSRRQGALLKRLCAAVFYRVFEWFSSYPVPSNPLNARLMTRRFVDSLLQFREQSLYMAGLWAMTGYRQVPVEVVKHSHSPSTYTLPQKLSMAADALLSFSDRPLKLIFYLGAAIMLLTAIAVSALIAGRLIFDVYLPGWTSVIVSIWLLGGMMIFCLGTLGAYLSRIFIETKHRPYTIVREVYSSDKTVVAGLPADDVSGNITEQTIPLPRRQIAAETRRSA